MSVNLDNLAEAIRNKMEEVNSARDHAYQRSRQLISICAQAIRAIHREEWDKAQQLIAEAATAVNTLKEGVAAYPDLYYAGYTQDAIKEYVEAQLTYALVRDLDLPTPEDLATEPNTWINGLAEAAMELRRRILDILRHGHSSEVERLLQAIDDIYTVLVTFDFNDAITGGLRRRTDTLRGVLERTRGDVTTSLRQSELEQALKSLEAQIKK
jgi:translin